MDEQVSSGVYVSLCPGHCPVCGDTNYELEGCNCADDEERQRRVIATERALNIAPWLNAYSNR